MTPFILIVEDEPDTAALLTAALQRRDHRVDAVHSAAECLERVRHGEIDIVITDVQMAGMSGVELCAQLRDRHPDVMSLVLTGNGDLETAVKAIRAGAYDFLTKPVQLDVLGVAIARASEHLEVQREVRRLKQAVQSGVPIPGIVGASPAMRELTATIRRVALADATVLITGESGTGKELVARALHALSPREAEPFVAVNCGAMPAPLLESELFGHVRGAFTDAKTARAGLLAQAGNGTIFLDEIGEMPLEMQAKLLRVLQERAVRPVGGDDEVAINARVVTATNRDLETEVEEKRFREDLYYRINVVPIHVPALRDRPGDVLYIAEYLLTKLQARTRRTVELSRAAARKLADYAWPGNVRELENCLERAAAICSSDSIAVEDLPPKVQSYQPTRLELSAATIDELVPLDEMERRYVRQVLESVRGNKTHAARILGIDRRSLYRRLHEPQ